MKIVNAVWEERNLGISSAEITAEISDQVDDFEKLIIESEQKYKYITVKVPTQRTDLTWLMGKMSYVFVEDMMFFEHDLHQITRTPLQQRLYDSIKVEPMSESDFPILFEEIDKGSFSFDRISNDPYFSKKLGTTRFHNWLYDEKERGAIFIKASYKGEMSGFFTIRDLGDGVYTSALGGTFMKFRRGGLGTNVQTPEVVKKYGGKKLVLGVSTNNMIQIRALIQNGFFPTNTNHVFVKHIDM